MLSVYFGNLSKMLMCFFRYYLWGLLSFQKRSLCKSASTVISSSEMQYSEDSPFSEHGGSSMLSLPSTSIPDGQLDMEIEAQSNDMVLPEPSPLETPQFQWGNYQPEVVCEIVDKIYVEIVHWNPNLFKVPSGGAGKLFTKELSRLFKAFGTGSGMDLIAFKVIFVMPALLLQRVKVKMKNNQVCEIMTRRLELWNKGEFDKLLIEARTIQDRFKVQGKGGLDGDFRAKGSLSRDFAKLMFGGKVNDALRLLTNKGRGSVLQLEATVDNGSKKTVRDILKEKHPTSADLVREAVVESGSIGSEVHPIMYEQIDGALVRRVSMSTKGAAGPSGLNAYSWRRLCICYKEASSDLCHALALTARRLCSEYIHPDILSPLLASHLIALDKQPGV